MRREQLCLNGDLVAEEAQLLSALPGALRAQSEDDTGDGETLSQVPRVTQIQNRLAEVRARIQKSATEFEFRGLPRKDFAALELAHPVPEGATEYPPTFRAALISACLTSHTLTPEEVATFIDESLSQGQSDMLFGLAIEVNRDTGSVPFSAAASATSP